MAGCQRRFLQNAPKLVDCQMPYEVDMPDLNLYFFPARKKNFFCPSCGCRTAHISANYQNQRMRKLEYDLQCSLDGVRVVSSDAKRFIESESGGSLKFYEIWNGAYALDVLDRIPIDEERSRIKNDSVCPVCGIAKVTLVSGIYASKLGFEIRPSFLYYTEISFGTCPDKTPIMIAGEGIAVKLRDEFSEISLHDIEIISD